MADERGPKKVGVYEGTGTTAGMNWTWIIVGLIIFAIILYLLFMR